MNLSSRRYAVAPAAALLMISAACSSSQSSSTSPSAPENPSASQGDETSPAPSPSPEPDPVDELASIFPNAIISQPDPVDYWGNFIVVTFPADDYKRIPASRLGEWLVDNLDELDGLGIDALLTCDDKKPIRTGEVNFKFASLFPIDSPRDAEVVFADQDSDGPGKTTVKCWS